jgi:hypothetical protein
MKFCSSVAILLQPSRYQVKALAQVQRCEHSLVQEALPVEIGCRASMIGVVILNNIIHQTTN